MSLKDKLFSFEGRLRRSDWWVWGIAVGLVGTLASAAASRLLFAGAFDLNQTMVGDPLPVLATSLALVAIIMWPTAALYAKRAHDLNWPAWPAVLSLIAVGFLPYLPYDPTPALSEGPATGMDIAVTALSSILVIGWFGMTIMLAFIDGKPGPNRFGPSPKYSERPVFAEPGGVE